MRKDPTTAKGWVLEALCQLREAACLDECGEWIEPEDCKDPEHERSEDGFCQYDHCPLWKNGGDVTEGCQSVAKKLVRALAIFGASTKEMK